MRRVEHHHNTDEQVREYVLKALNLVDELHIVDELAPAVFAAACNLYSGKQITLEEVRPMLGVMGGLPPTPHG